MNLYEEPVKLEAEPNQNGSLGWDLSQALKPGQ
jgi:hypothetical protein